LESLFTAAIVLFAFRLGLRPIGDNSMFTHLRTGIDMVAGAGIPRADPFSFTAHAHQWIVQSWLAEWTYGVFHDIGGYHLVVLEQGLVTAGLAWLIVRLARAGTPLRSAAGGIIAVGVGAAYWAPRPLMFGLVCMALTVTVVEHKRSPWFLVPIVWFWVQSHGSFPLGLAWLGARALGEGIDRRVWPRDAVRYIGAFVVGLLVSIINPLGIKLLEFPLTLGDKRDIFSSIVEWQSPNFQSAEGRFTLVFLTLAVAVLIRQRVPWRDVVPIVAFAAASFIAVRNVPVLAIVLAPCLGRALRRSEHGEPRTASTATATAGGAATASRARIQRVAAAVLAAAFLLFAVSALSDSTNALAAGGYPEDAVTFLQHQGLLASPHRLAHQDFVGNYITLRYGTKVLDFIDDRYDMFPVNVSKDYLALLGGKPTALEILDRRRIDVVLWQKDKPLASMLSLSRDWKEIYRKGDWVIYQRVGAPPR
jgi:hypothetical protein